MKKNKDEDDGINWTVIITAIIIATTVLFTWEEFVKLKREEQRLMHQHLLIEQQKLSKNCS